MSLQQPINVYNCLKCDGWIVTIDRDEGVTPMMLRCLASKGCDGMMESAFYMVADEILTPTYEWRRPSKGEYLRMKASMRAHIDQGGLEIYPIRSPAERERSKRVLKHWRKRVTPK